MATKAQIAANRRNAQRSTGPKTPEGKARSAQNALKHGIRAQAIISSQIELLNEDAQEFADLVQSLVDDLQPKGAVEEMCVETIAISLWRLRRIVYAELGHIELQQENIPKPNDNPAGYARRALPKFDTLDRLARYEAHVERQLNRALATLTKLQQSRSKAGRQAARESAAKAGIYREIIKHLVADNTRLTHNQTLDDPAETLSHDNPTEQPSDPDQIPSLPSDAHLDSPIEPNVEANNPQLPGPNPNKSEPLRVPSVSSVPPWCKQKSPNEPNNPQSELHNSQSPYPKQTQINRNPSVSSLPRYVRDNAKYRGVPPW